MDALPSKYIVHVYAYWYSENQAKPKSEKPIWIQHNQVITNNKISVPVSPTAPLNCMRYMFGL